MVAREMIVSQPPVNMLEKFTGVLSTRPGAASEFGDGLSNGQVGTLDECRVDIAGEPRSFETGTVGNRRTPNETLFDIHYPQALAQLDHLGVVEIRQDHPDWFLLPIDRDPLTEVSCERREVMSETIRTEGRDTTSFESGDEFMDNGISHGQRARTKLDDGDQLGFSITNSPKPDILLVMLDIGPQLIELQMSEFEVLEKVLMEFATMLTAASEPGTNSGFTHM